MHIACALGLDKACIQVRLGCTAEEPELPSTLRSEPVKTVQPRLQGR